MMLHFSKSRTFRVLAASVFAFALAALPAQATDGVVTAIDPAGIPAAPEAASIVASTTGGRVTEGIGLGVGTLGALLACFDIGFEITGTMEIVGAGTYCIGGICAAMPLSGLRMKIANGEIKAPSIDAAMWPTAMVAGFGMGATVGMGLGFAFLDSDEAAATTGFVMAGICHIGAIVSFFISEYQIKRYSVAIGQAESLAPDGDDKPSPASAELYGRMKRSALVERPEPALPVGAIAFSLLSFAY